MEGRTSGSLYPVLEGGRDERWGGLKGEREAMNPLISMTSIQINIKTLSTGGRPLELYRYCFN